MARFSQSRGAVEFEISSSATTSVKMVARFSRQQPDQFRAQIIEDFDVVESGNLAGVRTIRAELRPGPFFLRGIVVGKKQRSPYRMIACELARANDQQRRSRLAPAGEIEEIVVRPVAVKIVRALGFVRSEQKNGAAIGFARPATWRRIRKSELG